MRRIFSSFFAWLEDEDYIVKSPMRRIHKVKTVKTVKTTYTDEALEMMRDGCETLRDLAIVDLLASTGMRVGELVHLNRADIDFDNRECIVFGKGGKERKKYGIVENVSDRPYVSNSFHCHVTEDISPIEKQDLEGRFWNLCNGGKIQYVRYPISYNIDAVRTLVKRAMKLGYQDVDE